MTKSLLIVESPAKAKTLGKYLGKNFSVKASVGHVKDLPSNRLGIDLENNFQPKYQVISGKNKIMKELQEAAAKADAIYLGPDPDREGEAIAWHISEELHAENKPVYRVLFYELTQKAIQEAISNPGALNKTLYEAQQARRILDRLVGYQISPLLWEKVKKGLSAGRVQSVALRLVCEREREIQKFVQEEYWTITARLTPELANPTPDSPGAFAAQLWKCRLKKCRLTSAQETEDVVNILKPISYRVSKVEKKKRRRNPSPPFITSTLQQEAARKLRFTAKRTMGAAQRLYEGVELGDEGAVGLITYMRTDSTRLSQGAIQAAREYIAEAWGKSHLPPKPAMYKAKASAQDAHEAIRPTDVRRTPEAVAPYLTREQLSLYTLIWKRFVACQMAPAVINQTTVDIAAGDYIFRATGSVIEFAGFMALYVESQENEARSENGEAILPDLAEGQELSLIEIVPQQHFTQPPPRFSEASLIKELEERGIGRPSTYASILSTIQEREYVTVVKQRLQPTELGLFTNDLLVEHFPDILDVEFTARMEKNLDEIERGGYPSLQLLDEFYPKFARSLESAQGNMVSLKTSGLPTDLKCPKCGGNLHIKWSRNGPFIGCSSYPECSFTSDYSRDEKGGIQLLTDKSTGEICEKCQRPMVLKHGRFGAFLACSGYPSCKNTRPVTMGIPCPREGCTGELVERMSKRGRRFYGCTSYPECQVTFWNRPVHKHCPVCGSSVFIEKRSKRGDVSLVCANASCGHKTQGEPEVEMRAVEGKK